MTLNKYYKIIHKHKIFVEFCHSSLKSLNSFSLLTFERKKEGDQMERNSSKERSISKENAGNYLLFIVRNLLQLNFLARTRLVSCDFLHVHFKVEFNTQVQQCSPSNIKNLHSTEVHYVVTSLENLAAHQKQYFGSAIR